MYKKIKVVSIWALLTVVLLIPFVKLQEQTSFVNKQISLMNKDYLILVNTDNQKRDLGYKQEEIDYVTGKDGVKDVLPKTYLDNVIYQQGEYTEGQTLYEEDYQGTNLNGIFATDKVLDYTYGHEITKDNGIVISEKLARSYNKDLTKVIGQNYELSNSNGKVKDYTIEGIYNDMKIINSGIDFIVDDKELIKLNEDFTLMDQAIDIYNVNNFYESLENEVGKYEFVKKEVGTRKEVGPATRQEFYDYNNDQQYDGDVFVTIDYEKSKANGVQGLIDPNTKDYPEYVTNIMLVELEKDANKESIIEDIQTKLNTKTMIISNASKYKQIYRIPRLSYIMLILLYIITNIVLLRKHIKK